jgi:hypothetical protein
MMKNTALHHIPVETVFKLDGAPSHFSCHWIQRWRSIHWPLCSPYLTPVDFVGEVCKRYYGEKLQNVNELHEGIVRATEWNGMECT